MIAVLLAAARVAPRRLQVAERVGAATLVARIVASVAQAQRFTAMRELTKAVWVLGMRRLRHPILALADGLAAAGHIKSADDLEYCTYTEVGALAAGKEVADLVSRMYATSPELIARIAKALEN